jgi:uncharacterized protein (TIGR03435 family)
MTHRTRRSLFTRARIKLRHFPIHSDAGTAMSKFLLSLTLIAFLTYCQTGSAQQLSPPQPAYDAVTVKVNDSLAQNNSTTMDDTMFRAQNVTLKHLLVNAYGIREGLMFGLPGWAASLRFDINAKVTDPDLKTLHSLSKEQRQAMIAAILVDRFHLKLHTESKTLPVYELVVAKDGPKLTASAVPPPDAANPDPFGKMDVHNTDMTATGVTLSQLAGNLSFPLDRTVLDKTGLMGRYDFRLRWTADTVAANSAAADAPPSLFMAIQEQLGLKLQPANGPVETLVIDHVEQPSEN